MKPLLLEIQAFGPFVEKQIVDFEKLSENGIFLIKGETGSGKTTIFDAMTFALYGGGSGTDDKSKVGRNAFEEWRCNQAPDNLETVVSFVFSSHGKKYIFTRKLVPKRVKFSPEYEAGEIDENGNVIPFFNNPKALSLKEKAEEIIGLSKDQFRQVVLLPQGQFERFLTASSDEKTEILNKIFDADMWKRYAQKFYENANEKIVALKNENKEVEISLSEERIGSIEELKTKIDNLKIKQKECEEAHKAFDGAKRQEELNKDRELAVQFDPLHKLQKDKLELENKMQEIEYKEEIYKSAEKAEKLRSYIDEYEKSGKIFAERKADLVNKENLKPKSEENLNKVQEAIKSHEADSPVNVCTAKIGEYESKRSSYESFDDIKRKYQEAELDFIKADNDYKITSKSFSDIQEKCKVLYTIYEKSAEVARDYRRRYFAGIYGEIADSLQQNEKCPVCGSLNHPYPAEKSPDSVSKSDMEKSETEADKNEKSWKSADQKREAAEDEKRKKEASLIEKESAKNEAKAKLEAAKSSLVEGITNIAELNSAIKKLQNIIDSYNEKSRTLQSKKDEAIQYYHKVIEQIKAAKEEKLKAEKLYNTALTELNSVLMENGYSDVDTVRKLLLNNQQRTQLHEEITRYNTRVEENAKELSAKERELSGKTEPDSSKFRERQTEIKNESDVYNKTVISLSNDIDRLSKKYNDLSKKLKHYNENITSAEDDMAFAKKLRGDSGIGIQRYVLAIMFNQVIGEANEMLKRIHGGRYTLFRSDDKGKGNKRGLELKVHDNRSPEKEGRGVSMLSGGEKFLVSLALSIGMSTVAQKSGVQIEALFIDEGFGTLDGNSISDAMDVLENVRRSNSMIGIISHVELLEENIPTQLEVVKTESGNSIKKV